MEYNSSPKKIDIAFLNKKLSKDEIASYNKILQEKGITNTQLNIRQNDDDLKSEILKEINKQESTISEKDIVINNLNNELRKYKIEDAKLVKEMTVLFPELKDVSLGKLEQYPDTDSMQVQLVVLYKDDKKTIDNQKLKNWLSTRLNLKNVETVKLDK